jgi:hypothetical protein
MSYIEEDQPVMSPLVYVQCIQHLEYCLNLPTSFELMMEADMPEKQLPDKSMLQRLAEYVARLDEKGFATPDEISHTRCLVDEIRRRGEAA